MSVCLQIINYLARRPKAGVSASLPAEGQGPEGVDEFLHHGVELHRPQNCSCHFRIKHVEMF